MSRERLQERAAHCVEVLFALLEQTAKSSEFSESLTKLAANTARMLSLYLGLEPISLASSGKVGEGPAP